MKRIIDGVSILPAPGHETRVVRNESAKKYQEEAAGLNKNISDSTIDSYLTTEQLTDLNDLRNNWQKQVEKKLNLYESKTDTRVLGEVLPLLQRGRALLRAVCEKYVKDYFQNNFGSELEEANNETPTGKAVSDFEDTTLKSFVLGKISFKELADEVERLAERLTSN